MSFGFSTGDFIALGQLAWEVYRSCKDAPESFKNISQEVLSLHAVLREVEENISAETLPVTRQSNLKTIEDGCCNVLKDLQSLVDKYESLGTQSKRTWDRMKWGLEDITELRSRLTSNTALLTAFISTSQVIVEKKLNKFLQKLQEEDCEGSVVTAQTVESLSTDEKQAWRNIRKELEDIGITVAAFDANRDFIINWFREGIATGAFEEQLPKDNSSNQSCDDDLGQFWGDAQNPTTDQSITELVNPLNALITASQDLVTLEAQSSQTIETQRAKSPSLDLLPAEEINSSAKIPHTQVNQRAAQKPYTKRKYVPQVAVLIAWVLRRDKELIKAARNGQEAVVRLRLEKGADINAKDSEGRTTLYSAALGGNEAVVRLLLENGADVNAKNSWRQMALHSAALGGNEAVVQLLLKKEVDVNAKDSNGRTALHNAARKGHETVVPLLLEKGADVNAKDILNQMALHSAALGGNEAVVRLLLEKGADVNAEDSSGWTALHNAAQNGHEVIVRLLLEKGADVNAKDSYGRTALHLVARDRIGKEAVVRLLLEKGADVNAEDSSGWTALHNAAQNGHEVIVRLLLEKGADVDAEDLSGRTALYRAAWDKHNGVVQLLKAYTRPQ